MDDEAAFRSFVGDQWGPLIRTGYLLTGDHGHAEDLAQSTLIRVHRHWGRIARMDAPHLYARKVLVNLANSHWRRLWRRREEPVEATPEPEGTDFASTVDLRDELWSNLRRLPAGMRAVLVLRYYDGLSETQTAEVLNCSVGTVKSQASRGLTRLRAIYHSPEVLSPQGGTP